MLHVEWRTSLNLNRRVWSILELLPPFFHTVIHALLLVARDGMTTEDEDTPHQLVLVADEKATPLKDFHLLLGEGPRVDESGFFEMGKIMVDVIRIKSAHGSFVIVASPSLVLSNFGDLVELLAWVVQISGAKGNSKF